MTLALCVGAGLGVGTWLLVLALWPRRVSLEAVLAGLSRQGVPATANTPARSLWRHLVQQVASVGGAASDDDLAVLDKSREQHAVERIGTSMALGALPVAVGLMCGLAGVDLPVTALALTAAALATMGFVLPALTVRGQATAARQHMTAGVSSFLDLVTVLLAGGAGPETALFAAADVGDSLTFQRLRDALTVARTRRQSPWSALAELGARLGVPELVEVAATVQLAGEQGARVTASLTAKASALRLAQLAQVEAAAQASTERMSLPTVLLFCAFLALLGYPALQLILNGFA